MKLEQLTEVVGQAQAWVELRKKEAETAGHSWFARATAEEMEEMKNERFQVSTLEGKASSSGQFDAIIKIKDITESIPTGLEWEIIEEELQFLLSSLSQQKQVLSQLKDLSSATLQNVVQVAPNWEIDQAGGSLYTISGQRLGWAGDLTTGTWTYDSDKGLASASDQNSRALEKILSCEQ